MKNTPIRHNGKRSFLIHPLPLLAWAGGGYPPVTETEALLALGWIFRQLSTWKTKANVYDMMHVGSGCGHSGLPGVRLEGDSAAKHLRELIARLSDTAHWHELRRFAKVRLGYRGVLNPIRIPVRKPPFPVFDWLRNLHGCRLKNSPNEYHAGAVWLHGATLRLNRAGTRWKLNVGYSYRHEDGWGIGMEQLPGEKLEAFDGRAWAWLRDLIQWRHPEEFYHGFCVPADGMKRNELKSCADTERRMNARKDDLGAIFRWGKGAPGFWENQVAERMVYDASEQFRDVRLIEMTGARLRTLKSWLRQDAANTGARA